MTRNYDVNDRFTVRGSIVTCLLTRTGTATEFNNAKVWKMTEVGNKPQVLRQVS